MMQVATLTLNPAIDETIMLDRLVPGEVHRASSVRFNVGGKGINVAACLADFGIKTAVTGYLGADNSDIFEALFEASHIEDRFIRRKGQTRTNIKLVDQQGTTDINLSGDPLSDELEQELDDILHSFASSNALIVMAGSLLPQMDCQYYARRVEDMAAKTKIIVDCSGDALQSVLNAKILPYAIKPNIDELSQFCHQKLTDISHILQVAQDLISRGLSLVTVSMGAKGAVFVSKEQAIHAQLKASRVESTVGAGDAMVAGISAALSTGQPLERIARLGTAFAVGKLGKNGPALPSRDTIESLASSVECRLISSI
ncbi:1-phosphofructokinase family hexose kinase [Bartonella tamiae]|uniref:Phosphofructokinase n=1 Tax=Bartonella tamiae Th239 TaxID=1094558 RepID=J0QTM3_9HYPH|nr:1-phosphofructokinase family hexose kinase [Bartonella tamiae]EJF89261.1 1-phosphofructokinase family hexose kinase [Bartonella tamiae Th239]EJF95577.1 1-phosphofructokinase family hexose kinase [Bartonella tamiae Th307]